MAATLGGGKHPPGWVARPLLRSLVSCGAGSDELSDAFSVCRASLPAHQVVDRR